MLERRREVRVVPYDSHPVEVQIMGAGFLEIVKATDISVGGVGVYIPHGIDPGSVNMKVELILTLPSCRPAHMRGIICHRANRYDDLCHIGIKFVRPTSAIEKSIASYVERHLHRADPLKVSSGAG